MLLGVTGRKYMPLKESYPIVRSLRHDHGWSVARIARHMNKSASAIDDILSRGASRGIADTGAVYFEPDPVSYDRLAPEVKACVEDSPEAFERFFNRYFTYRFSSGESKGEPSPLQPHSKRFIEAAWGKEAVVLNVPPRHAKTQVFSVALAIWNIARNRDIQILLISNSRDQALKPFRDIENHLRSNRKLINDFGRFVPEGASTTWSSSTGQLMVAGRRRGTLSGDLTLLARGAKAGIYGFAADLIIADDICDDDNTATPDRRDKLAFWFHSIVETRLQPGGRKIVIGTRFHEDDLYGRLSQITDWVDPLGPIPDETPTLWEHINFPAVLNWSTREVLWAKEWPFERLMKTRKSLEENYGTGIFDQIYQQNPIPSARRTVQPEWIDGCFDLDRVWGPRPKSGTRVVSLDPSPTKFAGLVVADVTGDRKMFSCDVLEVTRAKMTVQQMLAELDRIAVAYSPSHLIIEVNAAQRWFLQDTAFEQWRRQKGIKVIPHTTSSNKADAQMGVRSLGADFEYGRIRLPGADTSSKEAIHPLVKEALAHPYGETDDVMMALWFIKWNHSKLHHFNPAPIVTGPRFHVPRFVGARFPWLERTPA